LSGQPVENPADEVQRALHRAGTPVVLVDFDETLWLRNSTDAFLASVRPQIVGGVLLRVLDVLEPWRLLPGPRQRFVYRDWLRVLLVSVLLPWSLLRWRRSAAALGARWRNDALLSALAGVDRPLVVTFGFVPIVKPLLAGAHPGARLLVASSLWRGYRLRTEGKQAAVLRELGADALAASLVITDSSEDADLLAACGTPLLIQWTGAGRWVGSPSYRPFRYTRKGKRAGQRYLLHNVLLEDVAVLWLAFAWTAEQPALTAAGLLLLHLSFWLVYEIGYHENDHVAAGRERAPHQPLGSASYADSMDGPSAWLCSLLLAAPGCVLLAAGAGSALQFASATDDLWVRSGLVLLGWVGYLMLSRSAYRTYNHLPVEARTLPYAVLQLTRTAGYGAFLSTGVVGALLLGALVLGRWIPYLAYRDLGVHLRGSHRLTMLMAFLVLAAVQAAVDTASLLELQTLVALAYLVARAHRPLRALVGTRGA